MTLALKSDAFSDGQRIPRKHTGDGLDVSPALAWGDLPKGTKELALIVDDPDAPREEPWVHWVLYKIPAEIQGLPEGVRAGDERPHDVPGAIQGQNTWGALGYRGPAPPKGHGAHRYRFHLYALDEAISAKPGMDKDGLLNAIKDRVIGEAELTGSYERPETQSPMAARGAKA
ncbi:MAG: YbhB/YbcL family Raf kinase inhibitor-like protein [Planctomycetota bacterium]|nr:YbhB/YbcL family Raf kinase inhibitor-like protein [Planctomycetota bacterium]